MNDQNKVAVEAVISGLVAGVFFGLMMQFGLGVMPTVGALYTGQANLLIGWIAHLAHSAIAGLVFAFLLASSDTLEACRESLGQSAGVGLIYGVLLWIVGASLIMPYWASAIGLDAASFPNFGTQRLAGHLVYGVVLGLVHSWLSRF